MKSRRSVAEALISFLLFAGLLALTANVTAAVAYTNREPIWKFKTRGAVVASPALSPDGSTLYVGSSGGRFYAIDTFSGESKWTNSLRLPASIINSATVDADGVIYVSCQNNRLYAITDLEDHGEIDWSFPTPGKHSGAPALAEDGTIYFGSTDNHLWALFPDGALQWLYSATNDVATPVVASDGTIYVVSGGYVRGVNSADGTEASAFTPGSAIRTVPALGVADILYFGANNDRLYALDPGASTNAGALWTFDTGKDILTSPAVGADGQIYVASESSRVYCLGLDGRLLWSVATRSPIHSALSIGADGTVYGGAEDGRLYAISPDGKILWTVKTRGAVRSSPAIDAFGVVYFGSSDSYVYAVETEAIPDSGEVTWQMFRKDAQHTARATECQPFLIEDPHLPNGASSLFATNAQTVSFSVTVRAGSAVNYQWQFNGTNIVNNSTATNATFTITNSSSADSGDYVVLISNDCGELESGAFTLEVGPAPLSPPVISGLSTNQFLLSGNLLALNVSASGEPPLVYQWRRNGLTLDGATNSDYFLTNALATDSGDYAVVITNGFGAVTSAVIRVTIFPGSFTPASHPLAAGPRHSLAVLQDGTLWAWGLNNFGQVGDGTASAGGTNLVFRDLPRLIGTNGSVTTNAVWSSVSGGSRGSDVATSQPGGFSIGLQTNGTIWGWGLNDLGQLGLGSNGPPIRSAVRIGKDTNWVQVEAGATHVLALKRDGSLWSWGGNSAGQLGTGSTVSSNAPVRVGSESAWVEVRAGGFYSLARRADGTLWAWGGNTNGQLGLGNTTSQRTPMRVGTSADWAGLSAGVFHALALKTNGTLWAWGRNSFGQLGTGGRVNSTRPVAVGTSTDWQMVEAGLGHSFAIKTNGALFAWGANWYGQLGNGTNGSKSDTNSANKLAPVAIATNLTWLAIDASSHSLGLTTDGRVWAWGWNANGQVGDLTGGNLSNTNNRNAPVLLNFSPDVRPPGFVLQPTGVATLESNSVSFSVSFTGAPQIFLQWYLNSNAVSTALNPTATNTTLSIPQALRTNVGFYYALITNHFGASTSAIVSLSVSNADGIVYLPGGGTTNLNAPRVVENPVSRTVQLSNAVTFSVVATGAPPLVYRWFFNSNPIDPFAYPSALTSTLSLTNALGANAGFYRATVVNLLGATTSLVASLTVTNTSGLAFLPGGGTTNFLAPGIVDQPTNQMVMESNAVAFSITVTGAPPFFYRWYFNSNVITDLANASSTNFTLTIPNAAGSHAGNYSVVVTNSFGQATSLSASLTVSNENGTVHLPGGGTTNFLIPRITSQPLDRSTLESNAAAFSVTVTGVPPFSFQWFFNSNALDAVANPGAVTTNFSLASAQVTNAGFYQVVITNNFGSATSVIATLTITNLRGTVFLPGGGITNYSVPLITTQPANQSALTNAAVSFTVIATGAPPLHFQWRLGSISISTLSNATASLATFTLTNVQLSDAGAYDVVVTNSFGMITSVVAQLSVSVADLFGSKAESAPHLGTVAFDASGALIPVLGAGSSRNLILEFKNSLSDPEWTVLGTNSGRATILFDPGVPSQRSRFYRLRLE